MSSFEELKSKYHVFETEYLACIEEINKFQTDESMNYLLRVEHDVRDTLMQINKQNTFWFKFITLFFKPKITRQEYIDTVIEPNLVALNHLKSKYYSLQYDFGELERKMENFISTIDKLIITTEYEKRYRLVKIRPRLKELNIQCRENRIKYRDLKTQLERLVEVCKGIV